MQMTIPTLEPIVERECMWRNAIQKDYIPNVNYVIEQQKKCLNCDGTDKLCEYYQESFK